jgi:hypothetical protein
MNVLLSLLIVALWEQSTIAAIPIIRPAGKVDEPLCYVQLTGQGRLNLDQICGMRGRQLTSMIDLGIDANGDGVSDQLLVELQRLRAATADTRISPQQYMATQQQFESRLPYSNQVKQLQAQQRDLQQQLQRSPRREQQQEILQQLRSIQQKIYQDPTYRTVQQEMSKGYSKLNF